MTLNMLYDSAKQSGRKLEVSVNPSTSTIRITVFDKTETRRASKYISFDEFELMNDGFAELLLAKLIEKMKLVEKGDTQ